MKYHVAVDKQFFIDCNPEFPWLSPADQQAFKHKALTDLQAKIEKAIESGDDVLYTGSGITISKFE